MKNQNKKKKQGYVMNYFVVPLWYGTELHFSIHAAAKAAEKCAHFSWSAKVSLSFTLTL